MKVLLEIILFAVIRVSVQQSIKQNKQKAA